MPLIDIPIPALVTALVGLFSGLLLIGVHRRNAFRSASNKFVETISFALKDIYPIPANWPSDVHHFLEGKFPDIQAAVATFQPHIHGRLKKRRFARTWVAYYNAYGDSRCQCYHHYMPFSGVSVVDGKEIKDDNTKSYKDNFRHNVENLLEYAKTT